MEEVRRNLPVHAENQIVTLSKLTDRMAIVPGSRPSPLPEGISMPDKDAPILLAAIDSGCTHLITGDTRHFGHLFGTHVPGVLIQTPAQYLRQRQD